METEIEKTVVEGNKLIAEFIGLKTQVVTDIDGQRYVVDLEKSAKYNEAFPVFYHSSWDWLMPVIQKIKDIILTEFSYKIKLDEVDVLNLYITAPITIVWEYAIYFIKMYNNQKQ